MVKKSSVVVIAVLFASSAGCETTVVLEPPVSTGIVPGIYSGTKTIDVQHWRSGILVNSFSDTEPYSEIVDSIGLPLIQPDGDQPVVGWKGVYDNAAGHMELEITDVNWSGNVLLFNFIVDMSANGQSLSGFGTWRYEKIDDNTITYTSNISVSGFVDGIGVLGTFEEFAELVRG